MLCSAPFNLQPGEQYKIAWELFTFSDFSGDSFYEILKTYPNYLSVSLKYETVFLGETIEISGSKDDFSCLINGKGQPVVNGIAAYKPHECGELEILCSSGGSSAKGKAFVSLPLDEIVSRRVKFIVENQQFIKPGHCLDGAYLIYDNGSKSQYFSNKVADHNASRERIGMGILIAKYLQNN